MQRESNPLHSPKAECSQGFFDGAIYTGTGPGAVLLKGWVLGSFATCRSFVGALQESYMPRKGVDLTNFLILGFQFFVCFSCENLLN